MGDRGDRRRPGGAAADGEGQGGRRVSAGAAVTDAGSPFTAIEFEGLQATPWVDTGRCKAKETGKCGARMAYSLKATGVRDPSRLPARPVPEHKDAA